MPRSIFPPRAVGGKLNTFKLFDGTGFNGVDQLDPNLTINSITVTPNFRYKLGDANATDLAPWTYGETLTAVGSDGTFNNGSPLLGSNDDSILPSALRYYTGTASQMQLGTDDFVIEMVLKFSGAGERVLRKRNAAPDEGIDLVNVGGNLWAFIKDGATSAQPATSGLVDGEWYHLLLFMDRSGSGQWYANGVASGAAVLISGVGDMDNADSFGLLNASGGGSGWVNNVAYIALWQQDAWLDTHLQSSVALERFHKLIGTYPAKSKGTALPTIATRASAAFLDKLEDSNTTRKLYNVGPRWMRIASRLDDAAAEVQGYLAEATAQNKCLQSEDLNTTWAKIDAGDTIGGSVTTPRRLGSTTSGIIGDATDGPHGVSQAVTLTAANYTFSCWAKKGDQDWLLIDNATIANGKVWFNLNTGTKGTQQSGVIDARLDDWGDDWYRCHYTFLGTAAAHTLEIRGADADNDTAYVGDGATVNTYAWGTQVELGNSHTTYIPTTTVAVTRSADALQYKGDDGAIKDTGKGHMEVTILKEDYDEGSDSFVATLSDGGAAADQITLYQRATNDELKLETRATSGNQGDALGSTDVSDGTKHAVIGSWQTDSVGLAVDTTHEGGDNSATIPDTLDEIDIGMDSSSANQFNGLISGFALFAKTLLKGGIGENFMAHIGSAYISATSAEAVVAGTFEKVAGTYTDGDGMVDFTHSAGVLTYTGTETKTFIVMAELSCSSGATNPLLRFRLAKNGTSIASSEISRDMGTAGTIGAMGLLWCIELAQNDTLEVQYTDDASSTLTGEKLTLLAVSV